MEKLNKRLIFKYHCPACLLMVPPEDDFSGGYHQEAGRTR